ncbi:GntR family transcriptional regulator [Amycolatopsis samaneae]|uniref:GntR family transcriptional regulator n=1 Tax=Amycolatopsis samaneae TaxID=664691 RepID=A0ABW5GII3_9PSEU
MTIEDGGSRDLAADRSLLDRTSTAERVADVLRTRIAEGYFLPGARLSEPDIGTALGVSRNTLREAFRLLTHERLLSHELNRGVFVRELTEADVIDLYRVRKLIECSAVRRITEKPPTFARLARTVADGDVARDNGRWQDLGTANIRFHAELAEISGSERIKELMEGVCAELRLAFHMMADPRRFYEPYLKRNHQILDRVEAGDGAGAEALLEEYLDDAEQQLVGAFRERAARAAAEAERTKQ